MFLNFQIMYIKISANAAGSYEHFLSKIFEKDKHINSLNNSYIFQTKNHKTSKKNYFKIHDKKIENY